jgi:hypothetical protein
MKNCKPVATPVDAKGKLPADGPPIDDVHTYRSLVGALQYLTVTRPDITFTVQQVCLHMHDPRAPHMTLLKAHSTLRPRHDDARHPSSRLRRAQCHRLL